MSWLGTTEQAAGARRQGKPSREMQELWFATRRRDWRSLCVVPASAGRSAYPIARALGDVGALIRLNPVTVVNAEGMDLDRIAKLVDEMAELGPKGPGPTRASQERAIVVALDPVVENPLVLPVVLAADAMLLCVVKGETDLAGARRTIDLVGRDRILGTVFIDPDPKASARLERDSRGA